MSMGYLLPRARDSSSNIDVPVVWRGLMVQKAVQQLLFDVDWTNGDGSPGLDLLVVDMPPGTGDVPLSVGQLANIDGSVIVSTPQDVSLADVRKSIAMFRKISVPINGLLLNQSYFLCPNCAIPHQLFGSPSRIREVARRLDLDLLGELPLVPGVSAGGDQGTPYALMSDVKQLECDAVGGKDFKHAMETLASRIWGAI
jgi:ATP-binding protein involved in chromosome partitioning